LLTQVIENRLEERGRDIYEREREREREQMRKRKRDKLLGTFNTRGTPA